MPIANDDRLVKTSIHRPDLFDNTSYFTTGVAEKVRLEAPLRVFTGPECLESVQSLDQHNSIVGQVLRKNKRPQLRKIFRSSEKRLSNIQNTNTNTILTTDATEKDHPYDQSSKRRLDYCQIDDLGQISTTKLTRKSTTASWRETRTAWQRRRFEAEGRNRRGHSHSLPSTPTTECGENVLERDNALSCDEFEEFDADAKLLRMPKGTPALQIPRRKPVASGFAKELDSHKFDASNACYTGVVDEPEDQLDLTQLPEVILRTPSQARIPKFRRPKSLVGVERPDELLHDGGALDTASLWLRLIVTTCVLIRSLAVKLWRFEVPFVRSLLLFSTTPPTASAEERNLRRLLVLGRSMLLLLALLCILRLLGMLFGFLSFLLGPAKFVLVVFRWILNG